MRPRTDILGRKDPVLVSERESRALASTSVQERRRAARAKPLAILHKVGCSWSARAWGPIAHCSAGTTTPPRFEQCAVGPHARRTGEPTVSHEGGSDSRLFLRSCLGAD